MKRAIAVSLMLIFVMLIGCHDKQMPEQKESDPMIILKTERTIIRALTEEDWPDLHGLAIDWSKAPGPEFDKWPTSEDGAKGLARHFAELDNFKALCLRDEKKVIGMLGLNGLDSEGRFDLGHVILSEYQNNDVDKEALNAMVDYVFEKKDVETIVTNNASDHAEQLAPLKSLGFRIVDQDNPGALILTKPEWEQQKSEE